ncbi:hypothetical protein [Kiloniella spongiae]|uniref:hypothetical protein n=1 Tax=Kiloniella spongiae TaxID=1489064 RepID=UPI00194E8BC1|nr:hypothetical protein [Kiloniella spongiae]
MMLPISDQPLARIAARPHRWGSGAELVGIWFLFGVLGAAGGTEVFCHADEPLGKIFDLYMKTGCISFKKFQQGMVEYNQFGIII